MKVLCKKEFIAGWLNAKGRFNEGIRWLRLLEKSYKNDSKITESFYLGFKASIDYHITYQDPEDNECIKYAEDAGLLDEDEDE